jgi:hypothetical protein
MAALDELRFPELNNLPHPDRPVQLAHNLGNPPVQLWAADYQRRHYALRALLQANDAAVNRYVNVPHQTNLSSIDHARGAVSMALDELANSFEGLDHAFQQFSHRQLMASMASNSMRQFIQDGNATFAGLRNNYAQHPLDFYGAIERFQETPNLAARAMLNWPEQPGRQMGPMTASGPMTTNFAGQRVPVSPESGLVPPSRSLQRQPWYDALQPRPPTHGVPQVRLMGTPPDTSPPSPSTSGSQSHVHTPPSEGSPPPGKRLRRR